LMIDQLGGMLCHPMRQLVADHVDGFGKSDKDDPIPIPKDHLLAIPEGVIIALPEMDTGIEAHALTVDRVALVDIHVEFVGSPEAVIRFINGGIRGHWVPFSPHQLSWEIPLIWVMLGVIDRAS